MMKNRRVLRWLIATASFACWTLITPVLAQNGTTPNQGENYQKQIFIACENPGESICRDLKDAIRSRTSFMPISYDEINPLAITAYLSTEHGSKSEIARVHVFGNEKDFTVQTSVPFPEISRNISYWSNAVSAILADAIFSKLGE